MTSGNLWGSSKPRLPSSASAKHPAETFWLLAYLIIPMQAIAMHVCVIAEIAPL